MACWGLPPPWWNPTRKSEVNTLWSPVWGFSSSPPGSSSTTCHCRLKCTQWNYLFLRNTFVEHTHNKDIKQQQEEQECASSNVAEQNWAGTSWWMHHILHPAWAWGNVTQCKTIERNAAKKRRHHCCCCWWQFWASFSLTSILLSGRARNEGTGRWRKQTSKQSKTGFCLQKVKSIKDTS